VRPIIEVDGGYHAQRVRADERRDRVLRGLGYRVLRFTVTEVAYALPAVLEAIVGAIEAG
jgi:very-short-patch-repair endonuclease